MKLKDLIRSPSDTRQFYMKRAEVEGSKVPNLPKNPLMVKELSRFEDLIVELGHLFERRQSEVGEEEKGEKEGLKLPTARPRALFRVSKESAEKDGRRLGVVKRVEDLEKSELRTVVRILKRLETETLGCSFRLVESGNQTLLWITKTVDGEKVRRSIIAPAGVENPLKRAGVPIGVNLSSRSGGKQV